MPAIIALLVLLSGGLLSAANAPALEAWKDRLAALKTTGLLVIHRGEIVCEWYAPGHDQNRRQGAASLSKAMVGGMSLMIALQDGRIGIDDPAAKYIPAWRNDPLKSKITIRHLATHSSGIEDAEQDKIPHMELPGWKGAFWKRTPDPFTPAIHQAPVIFTPGTKYAYSNPGMGALAYAVTASLNGAPQTDLHSLLKARVFDPLGVPGDHWSIGYGQPYEIDGLKLWGNWGGGAFTPRATARVGQLMMHEGRWEGKRLFDAALVRRMVAYAGTPLPARPEGNPAPGSGLGWWTNFDGAWPKVPRDAFAGAGANQVVLLVVPSLDLVAVRTGGWMGTPDRFWGGILEYVFDPLVEALAPAPPYPPGKAIRRITFAPESEIARDAVDSDNWPITWADDDALYTSYGDGWGFAPRTELKLSQGFAKILGPPESFKGVNIRSATGERVGDGAKGAKASGMLMVDGVLYMWVRNTGNAQMVWSEDRGVTWQWGFKFTESFGSPAFLNFGKNYAGARDGYVYTYSQDGPSAYESADGLVLARAPKDRIRDQDAWEFFVRLDAAGRPEWTRDIARRGHVFRYPANVQRVDAVYNPGLRRYMLALGYGHRGGWGIFDAPEPWGPWNTAFHTPYWGLGETHGYRLPSKWISADGRVMHLVFSGVTPNDAFCVRRMTLE
jgi:CubicO group peptidase (beta-lactamase class C family)